MASACRIVPRDLEIIYRDHMLDPLAALPWLAGVTRRISLGTSVVILPFLARDVRPQVAE